MQMDKWTLSCYHMFTSLTYCREIVKGIHFPIYIYVWQNEAFVSCYYKGREYVYFFNDFSMTCREKYIYVECN
jgi:hypothetical protein